MNEGKKGMITITEDELKLSRRLFIMGSYKFISSIFAGFFALPLVWLLNVFTFKDLYKHSTPDSTEFRFCTNYLDVFNMC